MPLLIAASIFTSIVMAFMGLYFLYERAKYGDQVSAAKRIRASADDDVRAAAIDIIRRDAMQQDEWYVALFNRFTPLAEVRKLLKQADSDMPVSVFLLLSSVSATVGVLVALYLQSGFLATVAFGVGGASLPLLYHRRKRDKRLKTIEAQLPDALDLIARTLLAGHAFIMGLKMVGEQMDEPIRSEFRKSFDEISFGISVPDAMKDLAVRVDLVDVKFFVTSLLVQLETGGNLAEITQGIASLIRSRFELFGKIQTLTAEGRISAMVMFSLPFGLGIILYAINPKYMGLLFTDPAGITMLQGGLGSMMIGMWVTRRMIQIKV